MNDERKLIDKRGVELAHHPAEYRLAWEAALMTPAGVVLSYSYPDGWPSFPTFELAAAASREIRLPTGWVVVKMTGPSVGLKLPVPMVLHCPRCGLQHLDRPDKDPEMTRVPALRGLLAFPPPAHIPWGDPPHKSHVCRKDDGGCGHQWRPADVPTRGVAKVNTAGVADGNTYQDRQWKGPLDGAEQRAIYDNPAALALLMNYHDNKQMQSNSMGAETTGNQVRYDELTARGREIIAKDPEIWSDEVRAEFKPRHGEKPA